MSSPYDICFSGCFTYVDGLITSLSYHSLKITKINKLANLNVGSFVGSQSYLTEAENVTIQSSLNEHVTRLSSSGFIFVSARVATFI